MVNKLSKKYGLFTAIGTIMDKLYYYNDKPCVRVIDFAKRNLSDSDIIESAINYAKTNNINTILFDSKNWLLDRAILYYSNVTFIVNGVTLKQANGVFDNIFRSEGFIVDSNKPYDYPLDVKPTENFKIIGENNAKIEGPDIEPKILNYETNAYCEPLGDIWGWRGISIYITCSQNFEISGFTLSKTRTWAISVERAKNAKFDERFSLLGLLLDAVTAELRDVCSKELSLTELLTALKIVKIELATPFVYFAINLEFSVSYSTLQIIFFINFTSFFIFYFSIIFD